MSSYKIQTYTGQLVDYLDPRPEMIKIEDIAKALSNECRFGGQSRFHYSVGFHSILMCGLAPKHIKLETLMDDSEEAYIKDLPTPLQAAIGRGATNQYRAVKNRFKRVIAVKFKLDYSKENKAIIKEIDRRIAATERDALFPHPQPLYEGENIEPYNHLPIYPESMINIEKRFLEMFNMYRRDNGEETIDIVNLREDRN